MYWLERYFGGLIFGFTSRGEVDGCMTGIEGESKDVAKVEDREGDKDCHDSFTQRLESAVLILASVSKTRAADGVIH